MKGFIPLVLGIFGTFAFSWVGLIMVPNFQIGHLDPQTDEEGTDIYPMPQSGMVARGREIYAANGCVYCHTQQVRADYAGSDIDRKWGERRSAPRDYVFAHPAELGKMRMGPDLANLGKRTPAEAETAPPSPSPAAGASPSPAAGGSPAASATHSSASSATPATAAAPASPPPPTAPTSSPAGSPAAPQAAAASPPAVPAAAGTPSALAAPSPTSGEPAKYSEAWHHQHLYSPRSLSIDSNMPAYRFLYEKRHIAGEVSADALKLTGPDAPPEGWEIVPTYDGKCLVAYLMSLDQSHPLKEVKSAAPAGSPAAAPAASPAASAAAGKVPK